MTSLSRYKSNLTKINEGTWITLPDSGLEIETRGFTDAYNDARISRLRRAAARFGGDTTRIPNTDVRKLLVDLLIEHCLLGIRNLQDETGKEVSLDTFKELLYEPAYTDLYDGVLSAASIVTAEREADLESGKKKVS